MEELKDMKLLPPKPGVCQECATDHEPYLPHNNQSLYYQYKFHRENGRFPTWDDAMAHCDEPIKKYTLEVLKEKGLIP